MGVTIYVAFYSRYGSIEQMAKHVAEGVREVEGAEPLLRFTGDTCTPENVRLANERWAQTHERLMAEYPLATGKELGECDETLRRLGVPIHSGGVVTRRMDCPPHHTVATQVIPLAASA